MERGDIDNTQAPTFGIPFDCVFDLSRLKDKKPANWIFSIIRKKSEEDDFLYPGVRQVLRTLVFEKSFNIELITFVKGEKEADYHGELLESADLPVAVCHACYDYHDLRVLLHGQAIEYYFDSNLERLQWAGAVGRPFSNWTELLFLTFGRK